MIRDYVPSNAIPEWVEPVRPPEVLEPEIQHYLKPILDSTVRLPELLTDSVSGLEFSLMFCQDMIDVELAKIEAGATKEKTSEAQASGSKDVPNVHQESVRTDRPKTPTDYDRLNIAFATLEQAVEEKQFDSAKTQRRVVLRYADNMTAFFNQVGRDHHAFQPVEEMRRDVSTGGRYSPSKLK